jgi:hypothetical protein
MFPLTVSCVICALASASRAAAPARTSAATRRNGCDGYFTRYLGAGSVIAITGTASEHLNLFVVLIWFFPLRVFNELVNAPAVGRFLSKTLPHRSRS